MPSDLSEIVKTKNPTLSLIDLTKLESFINEAILFNNKHNIFVRTGPLKIIEKDIDDDKKSKQICNKNWWIEQKKKIATHK